jgi:cysteinyl-tRNA synthetase
MTNLKIFNTLSGKKEEFIPVNPPNVNMYVCGITPYDETHMGHARCYVVFDMIRRYLIHAGYKVRYAQNFTDIDDKIIKRAAEMGTTPAALARKYEDEFLQLCAKLNIMPADAYPRVTQKIPEIIRMIEGIIKNGYAYIVAGDVYFSVRKFVGYGKLSRRKIDELIVGARVEPGENKADPLDFALWKAAKPGEPSWDSPWGKGRPGWHIECSTMSLTELKTETLDIHGGGQDLVFPHHENEIAQAEAYSGKQFAKYWVHNGFVTINKEKMSKSLRNFFTLKGALQKYEPMVIRYFLLSQHYRGALDFSQEHLEQALAAWNKVKSSRKDAVDFMAKHTPAETAVQSGAAGLVEKFHDNMNDDFNTSGAYAVLHTIIGEMNRLVHSGTEKNAAELKKYVQALDEICGVLGFKFEETAEVIPEKIKDLVEKREQARKSKNWSEADSIRKQIAGLGYTVEDTSSGPRIRKAR